MLRIQWGHGPGPPGAQTVSARASRQELDPGDVERHEGQEGRLLWTGWLGASHLATGTEGVGVASPGKNTACAEAVGRRGVFEKLKAGLCRGSIINSQEPEAGLLPPPQKSLSAQTNRET